MKKLSVHPSFDSLGPAYSALFAEAANQSGFFFSLPWFSYLAAATLADQTLRIYAIETGAQQPIPSLVLPMCHHSIRRKFFAPRRLQAATNFYASLFGPVTAASAADLSVNLALFVQAIAKEKPRWDSVDIHPMAVDSAAYDVMAKEFRTAGFAVQRYFCFGNWYLDVGPRSYQDYFESLPSRLKNTLVRKSRQLMKSHDARFTIILDAAAVEEGIVAFEKIYQASWKPAEAFPDFVPGLMRLCAQHGWLRLGIAHIDGQPAAAQFWIVCDGVASIYKLAYDPRFTGLSIGSLLTDRLMQHVIDIDRVKEVDYLTGDDAYKQDWMSARRERWGFVAFNMKTVRGQLAALRHIGGRALKNTSQKLAS